jgi:flagellar basal-body rod modification protein FlgD
MSDVSSLSANVSSLIPQSASTSPLTVTASLTADGSSIDASTSTTSGASSTGSTSSTSSSSTSAKGLGEDDFLKLLMTQLENQDPSSPMDDTQFISEMAQFQSLESSTNTEKAIEALNTSFQNSISAQTAASQSMANATSVSLIGKQVAVKESNVEWDMQAGATVPINIHLGNNSQAQVQILDSSGNVVRTLEAQDSNSLGSTTVSWDGKNDDGKYAEAGSYTVNVVGQDTDSSLYAYVQNVVTGVHFTTSGAQLDVGGQELSASDIMDVAPDQAQSGFSSMTPSSAVSLIGKQVRVLESTITHGGQDNEQHEIKVNATPNSEVSIAIADSNGNVVEAYQAQADATGVATFTWNGAQLDGTYAGAGQYQVLVDGEDNDPSMYPFTDGTVSGVSNVNGTSLIRIDGESYKLSDVVDVASASST